MPPLRFVLGRSAEATRATGGGRATPPLQVVPVSMTRPVDRDAVASLASQCRAAGSSPQGHFAAAGMLAELSSRPGRDVHAWLAWEAHPSTTVPCSVGLEDCPLGLVALVVTGAASRRRFSIAWLLVHPDVRRRGVATALVIHAAAHAESLGAVRVYAETLDSWPAAVGFWRSVGFAREG